MSGNSFRGASALPWNWETIQATAEDRYHAYLIDATGRKLATVYGKHPEKAENAALIVRSVNSHDELVAALQDILDAWESKSGMGTVYEMQRAIPSARAALARARGEQPVDDQS